MESPWQMLRNGWGGCSFAPSAAWHEHPCSPAHTPGTQDEPTQPYIHAYMSSFLQPSICIPAASAYRPIHPFSRVLTPIAQSMVPLYHTYPCSPANAPLHQCSHLPLQPNLHTQYVYIYTCPIIQPTHPCTYVLTSAAQPMHHCTNAHTHTPATQPMQP